MELSKVKEVFSDQEFVKSLFELDNPEDVQKALSEKDIDLSLDEINQTKELLDRYENNELTDEEKKAFEYANNADEELDEDELENVTGGSVIILVTLVAAGIVAAGVYIYKEYYSKDHRW